MAPGVTASRAVEVDCASWSDGLARHRRAADPDQSVVAAARRRLRRGGHPRPLRAAARCRVRRIPAAGNTRAACRSEIDGQELARLHPGGAERAPISIRLGRRRTPSAAGFLERHTFLPADRQGIAISTFGKVIKRGWDWLGISPPTSHISGLIEVPDLAACLTLSKNDFIRTGTRGATYLAYRKAIQEVVSQQLAAWGNASVPKRGLASSGSSGTSSAFSKIWRTTFRCSSRWSIAVPADRNGCRCRAAAANRYQHRSSRTCSAVTMDRAAKNWRARTH